MFKIIICDIIIHKLVTKYLSTYMLSSLLIDIALCTIYTICMSIADVDRYETLIELQINE